MFERGFKTWCEEFSFQLRRELALTAVSPLDPFELAKTLDIDIWKPDRLPDLPTDVSQRLVGRHAGAWSAITVSHGRRHLIIYNPIHSRARRNSDLMHELAHILLAHQPTQVYISPSGHALRTHDKGQEAEAAWLAGCLLLPRAALVSIRKRRLSNEEACEEYGVSEDLLRYRMNVTGVSRQLGTFSYQRT